MASERPLPRPDDASQQYWQGCRDGELRMQRCTPCGHLRFPPRPMCPRCQSFECGWVPVSGRGTVYSWVVAHPPLLPAFVDLAPLVVLLVELEEGDDLRIVGNLLGEGPEDVAIGMPVEVAFEQVAADVVLPQWRRRAGSG
ncbi:MAG: OB-fold domain-containing protein [Myxococcota bacterium]